MACSGGADSPKRKESAVLVPVFRDGEGELRVLLVVRGRPGVHGGQLGLPGGRAEPYDSSPLETALREAEEEIGLPPSEVKVLASLEPIDTRTTGVSRAFVSRPSATTQMATRPLRDQRCSDSACARARRPPRRRSRRLRRTRARPDRRPSSVRR
jgi:ADP-ribose pyrophosphatase YjhB (NUDIX family)